MLEEIKEEIASEHFSSVREVSNFGKFRARTVDDKAKLFLYLRTFPEILNGIGLQLPERAKINQPVISKAFRVNRFFYSFSNYLKDLETDSIHHDISYDQYLDSGRLGLSIIHMQPGPNFQDNYGRGLFLAGMSLTANSQQSSVFLVPAKGKYAVVMLVDHNLHGTESWSTDSQEGAYRTSYNFRFSIASPRHPIDLWTKIIEKSWNFEAEL
ncbi:MAG: hypothetical protein HRU09_14535 [Oligoflexales bacterium]|nr:hypothetical protein [Oligoflexales bacterium]